jgi:hypothetical protein
MGEGAWGPPILTPARSTLYSLDMAVDIIKDPRGVPKSEEKYFRGKSTWNVQGDGKKPSNFFGRCYSLG